MERTEIVSLYKNTPADGTVVTVCGWAKNIRDSKNIGFIALSDGGCFKTLQVVLEAGKLANYDEVVHTGLYSSLRVVGRIVLTPQAKQPFELNRHPRFRAEWRAFHAFLTTDHPSERSLLLMPSQRYKIQVPAVQQFPAPASNCRLAARSTGPGRHFPCSRGWRGGTAGCCSLM